MKKTTLAALSLIVAVTLGACVEDDASFYIEQNNIPVKGCLAPKGGGELISTGVLDVFTKVGLGYFMFPTVVNGMNSSIKDDQPERNNLHMKRFDVALDLGGAAVSVNPSALEFSVPVSGTVTAMDKEAFGPIQVIDNQLAVDLGTSLCTKDKATRPVVSVSLRAVAERSSETRESAEFVFPITLCCECLVDWRTSAPTTGDKDIDSNICGAPQDTRVTCYDGASGNPVCEEGGGT